MSGVRSSSPAFSLPRELEYRPKWKIAVEQVERTRGAGAKLTWVVFDEEYGVVPAFWFALDRLGQQAVGEVPANFDCWAKRHESNRKND